MPIDAVSVLDIACWFELAFDAMGIVDFRKGLQNLNAALRTMFG